MDVSEDKGIQSQENVPKNCIRCGTCMENYLISSTEELYMCPNTECSYPFIKQDDMVVSTRGHSIQRGTPPAACAAKESKPSVTCVQDLMNFGQDAFDIQAFLEKQPPVEQSDDSAKLTQVINELLVATNSVMLDFDSYF